MAWSIDSVESANVKDITAVQTLWIEYWRSFNLPQDFQGFAEELRTLPGKYAPPGGRLLLARVDQQAAGTFALRRLGDDACEAKRLYIYPTYRGLGLACSLLARVIEEARGSGYRHLYCDTLPTMVSALRLYHNAGFVEVSAYSDDPTPDAIYLCLTL